MSECTGHQITNSIIAIAAAATDDEDGGGSPISRGGRHDEERGRGATERARARNSASALRAASEGAPSSLRPSVLHRAHLCARLRGAGYGRPRETHVVPPQSVFVRQLE